MGRRQSKTTLTLAGAPGEVSQLVGGRFLKAFGAKSGEWTHCSRIYYDTADKELEAQGITLSLAEGDGEIRQTVTRSDAGGGARLEQFDAKLPPDARVFNSTGDRDIDAAIQDCGALRPLYRLEYDRWRAVVRHRVSKIAVIVDLGETEYWRNGARINRRPISAVSLSMSGGARADLFEFARLFCDSASVRLSALSKLDDAKALAVGARALIGKLPAIALSGEETAGDVYRVAVSLIAERITALPPGAVDGRDPYALYQLRVALRRFRAIERTFRPYLAGKTARRLAKRARVIGKMLGPARDWDVFLDETLPSVIAHGESPSGMIGLVAAAGGARAAAWAEARAALNAAEFNHFLIDLNEYALQPLKKKDAAGVLSTPVREFAPMALDRARRRAVKTVRATDQTSAAGRHRVRLALKKLRYSVQLFKSLYPKEIRSPYMKALRQTQDAYGALNDAVTAKALAHEASAGAGRAAGFIVGYVSVGDDAAAFRTIERWSALEAMTPFWRLDHTSIDP